MSLGSDIVYALPQKIRLQQASGLVSSKVDRLPDHAAQAAAQTWMVIMTSEGDIRLWQCAPQRVSNLEFVSLQPL